MNIQDEFEFGPSPMIFDEIISLEIRKKMRNAQFPLSEIGRDTHTHISHISYVGYLLENTA